MAYINLGQVIYPVGAYYFSESSTSPSTLFGGTWAAVDAGRFICAAGSGYAVGSESGANSVTLSEAQMPKHRHNAVWTYQTCGVADGTAHPYVPKMINWEYNSSFFTTYAGSSQAHENRPLYRAAYIWRRTK